MAQRSFKSTSTSLTSSYDFLIVVNEKENKKKIGLLETRSLIEKPI